MTEQLERRSDATRLQILRAASRLFARSPYSRVSLDDILADAAVTKGAMYFHFRSKHALACAIVELRMDEARVSLDEVLAAKLSGMETLIDLLYLIATDDLGDETTRAGLNLLESIGRTNGLQTQALGRWTATFTEIVGKAIREGDIPEGGDAEAIARVLVSIYLGLRQTSDLNDPARYLRDLESACSVVLPGFITADRLAYLTQFIRRRTAVAIKKATSL
ncbi:TetR/AcrR family transcriptional regulator [Mycobacterium sp. IDR2000157661]|uniref:TetR/AcrR family transcriptional regulator n=1 Tax=Mycobacterium sp. IDR2000157661 TaxID=2867005 RepID=UPI001EEB7216|nr:TetR/AcrR family transcriptional regulator [Mycobacterium sp. IDR2000157661]ULE33315.1 TetR/AcrR family transcriptional regulator [Mycobacterium sp. IDR2000157661]